MHEALYYFKKKDYVLCKLCPRHCKISDGEAGYCNVRKNIDGKLISLVYGKVVAIAVDPIEKKPLFHFHPGSKVFSFGTVGCNLRCNFCQNWEISQTKKIEGENISPGQMVELAILKNCKIIAATYNEPTIFYEYMIDVFKIAKEKGLKTVVVSNGFIEKEPLLELIPHVDAFNIDLKSIENKFYISMTTAWIKPILENIKLIHGKCHLELTNLIIPSKNENFSELIDWIVDNVGIDIPVHFSAYYPMHKSSIEATSKKLLDEAYNLAKKKLVHVYQGNIRGKENTYCSCGELLIERYGYNIIYIKEKCSCGNKLKNNKKDYN